MEEIVALIDADSMIFYVGYNCKGLTLQTQCEQLSQFVAKTVDRSGCDTFVGFLTSKQNFRHEVAKIVKYKGNRKEGWRPEFENELKQFLIDVYGFIIVDGYEADDLVGIAAYSGKYPKYVICSPDKDLNMLAGKHYCYRYDKHWYVRESETYRNYYLQVLTGDPSDNIPGLFKMTGKKATKPLKEPLLGNLPKKSMDVWCWSVYYDAKFADTEPDLDELLAFKSSYEEIKRLLWILREEIDLKTL